MTEVLDLAHRPISDRVQHEEVDDDRDAALSASATLLHENQDATARRIRQFKRLLDQIDPPLPILLSEGDVLRKPAKLLWEVRVCLPARPEHLDLRINSLRNDFAGQLSTHIRIEGVDALSDLVRVLRHRLILQAEVGERDVALEVDDRSHHVAVADVQQGSGLRSHLCQVESARLARPLSWVSTSTRWYPARDMPRLRCGSRPRRPANRATLRSVRPGQSVHLPRVRRRSDTRSAGPPTRRG